MSGNGIDPLVAICELSHPVAELARDFLARGTEWSIDDWFTKRAKAFFMGEGTAVDETYSLENLTYALGSSEPRQVRLVSIRPYHFRGFRQTERAIDLDADLVFVEGWNSSGKTSLAEAIEWLLTGRIQRREQGDPRELAAFVANRFRPEGQPTFVECILQVDGANKRIKRVLVKDYGTTKESYCITRLSIDGTRIEGPRDILADYFDGVEPLLMQQTLREFVLDPPVNRPKYFERLLNIELISNLIEDAQVTKQHQIDFRRPQGGRALDNWRAFTMLVGEGHFRTADQFSKLDRSTLENEICNDLVRVAAERFDAESESNIESCVSEMTTLQEQDLERSFPLLQYFRPKESYDKATLIKFSDDSQIGRLEQLEKARRDYLTALDSQKTISKANVSIAKALEALREAQLIKDEDQQICPMCDYQQAPTLTKGRLDEIGLWIDSWHPIEVLVEQTKGEFERAVTECLRAFDDLVSLRDRLVPSNLPGDSVQAIEEIKKSDSFKALVTAHTDANRKLLAFDENTSLALTELKKCDPELDILDTLRDASSLIATLQCCAQAYAQGFGKFEQFLNELAMSDEDYKIRDSWLTIASNRDQLILDIQWEAAKDKSRIELEKCRKLLIDARQKYLESRRKAFSDEMTSIWSTLRKDDYSAFSEVVIPEPRGRGLKARIEVKAKLSSNSVTKEVDALSVLSESQINAIGIAAFVTRSKLLGHKVLVFDDPVQSMDEDHFNSFADGLLSHLCDCGFQVIILTHNEDFARAMNCWNPDPNNRITLEIKHIPNKGINVYEGHRSVSRLLSKSLANWNDGEYKPAWTNVRIAVEQLFLLIRMKHGQKPFDWRKWKKFTAKQMWNDSIRDLLIPKVPEIARKMPAIVDWTAGGAHNRRASGFTDFSFAVDTIRELHCKMDVGD